MSYIYDAAGNPVEHIDPTGTVTYYQHDQYGSTRHLTDSTGIPTATFTFDAYGKLTSKTGTGDTVLKWNGQCQDSDTGLYYLRNRYFDSTTAQFISVTLGADAGRMILRNRYELDIIALDTFSVATMGAEQGVNAAYRLAKWTGTTEKC
ncbi:RHS repeat-associated core domain-containing protein [Arthrobacter sp. EpRS71]|uniref:RHS repeat-associated core domain-containing protein n=1 Tax=Arthrobacter sp. EpRS71 TaxID=1743141 RepID=UPI00074754F3|nr:RHS repeat-associated core domain-containing protein [Arthrobacter sp. EpRS71]KUM34888.1 hypothetical protein AR689_12385 [Arthrobacter sp. EpRS71]